MDDSEFQRLFADFRNRAFRLEVLPAYNVPEETADLAAFVRGEPLPVSTDEEWIPFVADTVSKGKKFQRVRLVPHRLTPYLRFEIEWGYVFNDRAGEEIRFLLPSTDFVTNTQRSLYDFWMFDDTVAFRMNYDEQGTYRGVTAVTETAELLSLRELQSESWAAAIPLRQFLSAYRSGQVS
jgi:hypothetical protein